MMEGKLIRQKFNAANHANLWALRTYHGKAIEHYVLDGLGSVRQITGEHADRFIAVGQCIYADIPFDANDPNAPTVEVI